MCKFNSTVRRTICATLLRTLPEPVAWKMWLKISSLLPAIIAALIITANAKAESIYMPYVENHNTQIISEVHMVTETVIIDEPIIVTATVEVTAPTTITPTVEIVSSRPITQSEAVVNYWSAANDTGHDCQNDYLADMTDEEKQTHFAACLAQYPEENAGYFYWQAAHDTGHDCLNDWLTHLPEEKRQMVLDSCLKLYPTPDSIPAGYVLRVPQSPDIDHTAGPNGLCLAEYIAPDGEFVVFSVVCQ